MAQRGLARSLFSLSLVACFSACAGNYVSRTDAVRYAYQNENYQEAYELIEEEEAENREIDRLLVLMDKGMILHTSRRYQESIQVLQEAEKLADNSEYTSISEEAKALFSNERNRAYRGEDFERLMINVVLALNYSALGREEDALVEIRRINNRLKRMINEEKKPYQQLAIARYLGGILYESRGETDSAFIDYYKAYQLNPNLDHLAEAILRIAKKAGRDTALASLKKTFPELSEEPLPPNYGEIAVVVEMGLSPQKFDSAPEGNVQIAAVPRYRRRNWNPRHARIEVLGTEKQSVTVTSLEDVAILHLNHRVDSILAKSLASAAVKAATSVAVAKATKSEAAGWLTFLLLSANTRSDLRSWLSLPAEIQIARFAVPAGTQKVKIQASKSHTAEVDVKPGKVSLLIIRSY